MGDKLTVSDFRSSGRALRVSGRALRVSGRALRVSGRALRVGGRALRISGRALRISGLALRVGGRNVRAGGRSELEQSKERRHSCRLRWTSKIEGQECPSSLLESHRRPGRWGPRVSDGHRPPLHFVKKRLIEAIGEPGKSIVAANLCLFHEEETIGRSDFAGKWAIN